MKYASLRPKQWWNPWAWRSAKRQEAILEYMLENFFIEMQSSNAFWDAVREMGKKNVDKKTP